MAKYKFEDEEDLGKVVESVKPFCTLSPSRDIVSVTQLTQGICGSKFSKLCGFTFRSKDGMSTKFLVVYCPKARSSFVRGQRGLSGWYCWLWRGAQDIKMMPKEAMLKRFMFNVDKFFQSDMFEKFLPVFKRQTEAALGTTVKKFLDELPAGDRDGRSARFMVQCTKASLDHLADVVKDIESGESDEAKLAYNANSEYSLDMKARKAKNYAKFGQDDADDSNDDEDGQEEEREQNRASKRVPSHDSIPEDWVILKSPLKSDVEVDGKVIIPAGATGVPVLFGGSQSTYRGSDGAQKHFNVYKLPNGTIISQYDIIGGGEDGNDQSNYTDDDYDYV